MLSTMLILLAAVQADPAPATAATGVGAAPEPAAAADVGAAPERFSILAEPCAPPPTNSTHDVLVCGRSAADSLRVLPAFRGVPNHPVPMNPDMKASVALNGRVPVNECGVYGEDCPVAGGGYVVPKLVAGAVDLARGAFARKPDKTGRVAIDLDAPPPAGRLLP